MPPPPEIPRSTTSSASVVDVHFDYDWCSSTSSSQSWPCWAAWWWRRPSPLFSASMVTESSTDEYPVLFFTALWFPFFFLCLVVINKLIDPTMSLKSTTSHRVMALVGGMNSLNGVLVVYASDPDRTSPQLQAILGTSVIPFTVICRYIILRKGDKNYIISTQASHNIIIATTAIVINYFW